MRSGWSVPAGFGMRHVPPPRDAHFTQRGRKFKSRFTRAVGYEYL